MPPPKPGRDALIERYESRRAETAREAAHVFARRGYDQTTVPQLASELGIATGSLYHYFSGKEELLVAICDALMDPMLALAERLDEQALTPADHLRELVGGWVAHVATHRDHMLVFQQERHVVDHGDRWRGVRDARKRFERHVGRLLETLHADGLARLDDPRLSLAALLGMVNHTAQWYRPHGRLDTATIANGYVRCLLADPVDAC